VTEVGETRPRHQAHITRANHRYAHRSILVRIHKDAAASGAPA
jgi:hypothetical protein